MAMNDLYPLKFKPIFRDKIWGGDRIRTVLGLDFSPLPNCGEAWVLSGVPENQTRVSEGFLKGNELNELVEVYMDDLVGEKVYATFGNEFPILVKFIDANDYLSIQVHPDDNLARKRRLGNGKTEMWYILDAMPGAELISGFNRPLEPATYLKHLEDKTLPSILNAEKVQAGDLFFMPAGRVHALGPGILLAEIQQSSDTTYRIYDWDRVDAAGKSRELHTEEALEAIDFTYHPTGRTAYRDALNRSVTMVSSPQFNTNMIHFDKPMEMDYSYFDSFIIFTCAEGSAAVTDGRNRTAIRRGETMLIPACMEKLLLIPDPVCKILATYMG